MKRLFKVIGGLLAVLLVLLVLVVVLVPLLIDPNEYRGEIAAMVEQRTGREFVIEGDLDISFYPWLGFEVGAARLANPPGFAEEPFASMSGANVRVRLLPLLRREVEMDALALQGLRLHLIRDEQGRTNWEDLLARAEEEERVEREAPERDEPGWEAAGALTLGGIEMSDALIVWDDRTTGVHYTFERVDLRTGAFALGEPVRVQSGFDFVSRDPELTGRLSLSTVAHLELADNRYRLEGLDLSAALRGEGLPPDGAQARMQADVEADLDRETLSVSNLRLTGPGLSAQGAVQAEAILSAPRFQGGLEVPELNPREVLAAMGQPAPETADPAVLQRAGMSLQFTGTPEQVRVDPLEVRLDDTSLVGHVQLTDLANVAVAFDLSADRIDLDRYLPPPAEEPVVATPAGAAAAGASELPVETLRALRLDGTLRVGELKVSNLTASDMQLVLSARDGVVRLHPATAVLYGGRYEGDMRLDVRTDTPQLTLDDRLIGVQAGPLLVDFTGEDRLLGTADLSAKLSATDLRPEHLRTSLTGNARFAFRDGAIRGINVAQVLREVHARIQGQPAPETDEPLQTDFTELSGSLVIADGVARNDDLDVKSPLLRVTGTGAVDLVEETVDYQIRTILVGTLEGQHGREITELRGVTIPIRVSGRLDEPSIRPDMEAVLAEVVRAPLEQRGEALREDVKERVEERREELRQDVEDRLKRGLDRLLR
jgi:AsmA protein